jgi:hypothetical protein
MAGHGVQFIAVHVSGTEAIAQTWLTGLGVTFPAVQDSASLTILGSYSPGNFYVPHLYIIGRDGVIRYEHIGSENEDVIEGHIMDVVYMRAPIDIEMIMDVSYSMNSCPASDPGGDSKLTLMRRAASIVTEFLTDHGQTDDRMGLVWFTDDATEYVGPGGDKLISVQDNAATLNSQINTHGTGSCTAMGAGLQIAFDTLSASTQKRFAILCTDGMQNVDPKVVAVGDHFEIIDVGGSVCGGHSSIPASPGTDIAEYQTCIHTIGVGITATYATLLQDLANATGGFYKGTDDPDTDLDLIYILDLCKCMAGGSPAVAHHGIGVLIPQECQITETFRLNRTVRKITVALSWQRSVAGNLTFWLRSPDGTLLDLHQELNCFSDHCLATLYLPRLHNGRKLQHVGQWQIIIRGETGGAPMKYHSFVIAEDRETHFHFDYPRRLYEVGDMLPLQVRLMEKEIILNRPQALELEIAHLPIPIPELLAQFPVSRYEASTPFTGSLHHYSEEPLRAKIRALATDPRFAKQLTPLRSIRSLEKGDLKYQISNGEFTLPLILEKSGLHSFKISIQCETKENGPICRTDMVTVNVGLGKPDVKSSLVNMMEITARGENAIRIRYTPRNRFGTLLGPGYEQKITAVKGKQRMEADVEDLLNGTYLIDLPVDGTTKKKQLTQIMFEKDVIWKGEV